MNSEVWELYQDLLNHKYESIEDYLTSTPADAFNRSLNIPIKEQAPEIKIEGCILENLSDNIEYGL